MNRVRRLPRIVVAFAIAACVALLLSVVLPALPTREVKVQVDLRSSAGTQIALYLNDVDTPPQVQQLTQDKRVVYEFDGRDGDISRIRVDVFEATQGQIDFYGIRVLDEHGDVLANFPPEDLATWAAYVVSDQKLEAGVYSVTARGPAMNIDAFRTVSAPSVLPGPIEPVIRGVKEPERLLRNALLILGLGAALLGLYAARGRQALALGVAGAIVSVLALDFVVQHPSGIAPASHELGRSTYLGLSMPTNVRAIQTLYLLAIVLAVGAAAGRWWLARRAGPASTLPPMGERPRAGWGWAGIGAAALTAVAAIAVFIPDLQAVVLQATEGAYVSNFDLENLLVWREFAARGLVPMDDFWYPYGNFSVFDTSLVKGEIAYGLYQLALFAGFWWVFWVSAGRRLFASSVAAVALLALAPVVGELSRYGLGVAIALAYTCIDPEGPPRLRVASRVIFGLLATLGFFLDPILVGYAAFGVGLLLLVDVLRARRLGLRWWARRLAADFALPVVGLVAAASVAALQGQLDGLLHLYLSLNANAIYSAEPTILMTGLRSVLDVWVLMVWVPPVLLAIGLFGRLTEPSSFVAHGLSSRLLVIGAVAIPLLLKHAVRPTPSQPRLFLLVGLIVFLLWASARPRAWPALGVLGGVAVALAFSFPGGEAVVNNVRDLPTVMADDARLLLVDREELDRARRERFADERFVNYTQELAAAKDIRSRPELSDDTELFVLGEAPILYTLVGQRPPWHLVPYNASPMDEQRTVVDWLERERPTFVVVDRNSRVFDGVPEDVRVPLIFHYVMRHYEYDHAIGPYHVLMRRPPNPAKSAAYWSAFLGSIELGETPEVSSYDEPEDCRPGSESCAAFLVLEAPTDDWNGLVEVPLEFGGRPVVLRFTAEGEPRYTLPLARTWPWALSTDVRIEGPVTQGWGARIVAGEQPEDRLY